MGKIVSCDFAVAGAGIVGLATARALRNKYPSAKITVFEKEPSAGLHASGRNSGVIHSGIYYPPGSLKAKMCARGGEMMKRFAEENGIPYKKFGKVIIATREEDLKTLDTLMDNAKAGGVEAVLMNADSILRIEPHCGPYKAGIHIPGTSVISAKKVVLKLAETLEKSGVEIIYGERVISADPRNGVVTTNRASYSFGRFFNCAGAYADKLARQFGLGEKYRLVPFKGVYRKLKHDRRELARGNIYPAPDMNFPFLGVHFTRSVDDDVYVGPTAIPALGRENYAMIKDIGFREALEVGWSVTQLYLANNQNFRRLVREELGKYGLARFTESARRLVPGLRDDDLEPSNKVGIRPQLVDIIEKKLVMDYVVLTTDNSTHALNAISPAFTSAFAFSEFLVEQV